MQRRETNVTAGARVGPCRAVRARRVALVMVLGLCLGVTTARSQVVPDGFTITTLAEGLGTDVVGFTFLPDGRILVIRKEAGTVTPLVDGVLGSQPALTVSRLQRDSERGLLGIAVDPDFPDSNYVYLYYTRNDSTNRVEKFAVTGDLADPGSANIVLDPASAQTLITFPDTTRFHNAGTLRFGSDKTLFISHGDDAYADRVQSLSNVYGKIFRMNRDGSTPSDNPVFPDAPVDAVPQTYAFGLRNPFRFSIDPATGVLFIGDVGTNLFEEFNLSYGGENFGYPHYEGPDFFRPWVPLIAPEPTFPAFYYPNDRNAGAGSAVALAAYRPVDYPADASFPPEYDGAYFYSDFFDDELKFLLPGSSGTLVSSGFASGFARLVDGGVGRDGSLHVLEFGGSLFRIAFDGGGVRNEEVFAPTEASLRQNYPNPFRTTTTISFELPTPREVSLTVQDVLGRRVATIAEGFFVAGSHSVTFDAGALASGVYLYRLWAGGSSISRSLAIRR